MATTDSAPRVLIVDDDSISLRFLGVALLQSGYTVATAVNGAAALAADHVFDLLLIDRHLPDIGGVELLHALRERGVSTPAIATSAEIDAELGAHLRAAGFADVIEKPASLQRIHEIVAKFLPKSSHALLDDTAALDSVGGDPNALRALRGLLARELEELEHELTHGDLATDSTTLVERLHRLRASCGFCGAAALAARAVEWQTTLRAGNRPTHEQRDAFVSVCRETRVALRN